MGDLEDMTGEGSELEDDWQLEGAIVNVVMKTEQKHNICTLSFEFLCLVQCYPFISPLACNRH